MSKLAEEQSSAIDWLRFVSECKEPWPIDRRYALEILAHIERLEAKVKRFEQAGIRWYKEQVEETFDQWVEDDATHWLCDKDAAWQAWMYVHQEKVYPMMKRIERLESAVRAVKDWDIENFKLRGAFVVPQQIRQMIQAATHGEGE